MNAGLPLSADVVERTPPEVIRLLQQLLQRIDTLEAENRELKARLGLNSSNSSKPPSTDPPSHKRKPPEPKSGRKRGGQPGHRRHERPLVRPEQVDEVIDCRPPRCADRPPLRQPRREQGSRTVTVVLRRRQGQFSVQAQALLDGGGQSSTAFVNVTDAPHAIELDWRRASTAGANDGSLQLWIDGAAVAALGGLNNDTTAVDMVRLGPQNLQAGASGTLLFDRFESRRQTPIGP